MTEYLVLSAILFTIGCVGAHVVGEPGEHVIDAIGADEHVHVDVDRSPRPSGAPCQGQRATEGMGELGRSERAVDGHDLPRQALHRSGCPMRSTRGRTRAGEDRRGQRR